MILTVDFNFKSCKTSHPPSLLDVSPLRVCVCVRAKVCVCVRDRVSGCVGQLEVTGSVSGKDDPSDPQTLTITSSESFLNSRSLGFLIRLGDFASSFCLSVTHGLAHTHAYTCRSLFLPQLVSLSGSPSPSSSKHVFLSSSEYVGHGERRSTTKDCQADLPLSRSVMSCDVELYSSSAEALSLARTKSFTVRRSS